MRISRGRALVLVAAGGALVASLVFVLPSFADLPGTLERLTHGDARWLVLALGFEAVSFLGHIILFRAVGDDGRGRVGMRASTEITLAGHAATRLFASGGAGGVALTAGRCGDPGMERADVAARMTTFLVLLYAVYMAALVLGGVGLFAGVLPGTAPLALTLVPAAFGAAVIAVALALPRLSDVLERAQQRGRSIGRIAPAARGIGEGVRDAVRMVRRLDAGLVGAVLWWAGDVAVLWACFEAFGQSPALAVVVMAYFIGMLANTLPLPGGIGGVDGGMVAALVAFGTDPALAVVAVLAYRGFAFWLPIIPGAAAWITLRRTVAGWQRARCRRSTSRRRGARSPPTSPTRAPSPPEFDAGRPSRARGHAERQTGASSDCRCRRRCAASLKLSLKPRRRRSDHRKDLERARRARQLLQRVDDLCA